MDGVQDPTRETPPPPILAVPFQIGAVSIPNRVVLAPMAGLTSSAYRRHMKAYGAGLVVSEMVSAQGLLHRSKRTAGYLAFSEVERPIAIQLFGDSPDAMAAAAEVVLSGEHVPDLLDINMGCPTRKVVKTGAGCALLGDMDRATKVAGSVVEVARRYGVPVTVKLRGGLRPGDGIAARLAPRLESAGIAAVGVHPRAASEYYRGKADHSVTEAVCAVVSIPVMASGDVDSVESATGVVEATGAAAVMVARGGAGNPWLLRGLLTGEPVGRPPLPVVVADLRKLLASAAEEQGEERAARWIRKALTWYLRPSRVPTDLIEPIRVLTTAGEVDTALQAMAEAWDPSEGGP